MPTHPHLPSRWVGGAHPTARRSPAERSGRERSSDCRLGGEFCPSARPGDWPTLRFCAGPSSALKSTAAEPRRQRRSLRPGSGRWVGSHGPFPGTSEWCHGRGLVPSSPASTLLPTPWIGSEGPGPLGAVGRASRRSGTDAGQQGRESPLDAQLAWSEGGRGAGTTVSGQRLPPPAPAPRGPADTDTWRCSPRPPGPRGSAAAPP